MPLPSIRTHGAKQCSAHSKRSGLPCKNPAAYGCKTCRMHGAKKPDSIKRGTQHPNYVHGARTLEAKMETSRTLFRLRQLEELAYSLNMIKGKRTSGRKPYNYKK